MTPLLALFVRSLRQDSRMLITYAARAGLVALMLVMMLFIHENMGWAGAPGLEFFSMATFVNFFFISLAGVSYFASAITEEKEENALGLLQMTNLSPLAILLGKSTTRLCGALLLLISQVPFTMLAVTLGGVSVGQITAVYCTLGAYLLLLSNLALFFSVVCARTAGASILTGIVLFVFLAGHEIVPEIKALLDHLHLASTRELSETTKAALAVWADIHPGERLGEILATGFGEGPVGFQVISNAALGVAFFLLAWGSFHLFCTDQHEAKPRRALFGKGTSHFRFFSYGRPGKHPIIWKDFHFMTGGKMVLIGKLLVYGIVALMIWWEDRAGRSWTRWSVVGYATMGIMGTALSCEIAIIVSRVFRQERRWHTLASLGTLPDSLNRIAYQKLLGCALTLGPVLFYFLLGFLFASGDLLDGFLRFMSSTRRFTSGDWVGFSAMAFLGTMEIFFFHLVAYLSLRVKWGALPLSVAICFIGGFVSVLVSISSGGALFIFLAVLMLVLSGKLHVMTGARLHEVAAEE